MDLNEVGGLIPESQSYIPLSIEHMFEEDQGLKSCQPHERKHAHKVEQNAAGRGSAEHIDSCILQQTQ
jgi:hypothetical protein